MRYIHYKVFLDTNIYDMSNYSFRNELFKQLRSYAQGGTLELQINSVVKNEVRKHIKKRIKETAQGLNQILSSRDLQLFRTLPEYEARLMTSSPNEWVNTALEEFDRLLKDCNAEEITSNGIDVEGIVDDYNEMRYPFENAKKDEFPDAIIVRAIAQEINGLSHENILFDYAGDDGISCDMMYCVVSDDKGFRAAVKKSVGERPNEDIKLFSSLFELINFFAIQDNLAIELQEKLNDGYLSDLIKTTIEEGIECAAYLIDDPDGYVDDSTCLGTGDYKYNAYVIGLQQMSDGKMVARIYLETSFVAEIEYEFLNDTESCWDHEDHDYIWTVMTEKVATFTAAAVVGFTITISADGEAEFNDYMEIPSEIEVNYADLIEVISCESRSSI